MPERDRLRQLSATQCGARKQQPCGWREFHRALDLAVAFLVDVEVEPAIADAGFDARAWMAQEDHETLHIAERASMTAISQTCSIAPSVSPV